MIKRKRAISARLKDHLVGASAGAIVTLAATWIGMPYLDAWRSVIAFHNSSGDYPAKCDAGSRAAEAYRKAGDYSAATEWDRKVILDCLVAKHSR